MQELREQLAEMVDEAAWEWLMPHAKRDAVLVVNQNLDLLDVGVAIANDNVQSVRGWVDEQLLCKPSANQLSDWGSNPSYRFNALIVQPYVLIQEMA
jgi:hypothetical protein